ncbi:hypothetical protein Q8F55_003407 [Vanrija albida]|uniref:SnoaL-like domain-containing protein n=1 Tax=Vanrija albida TaxID=181172 RepID=A0ABR3Q3V8_9TREE
MPAPPAIQAFVDKLYAVSDVGPDAKASSHDDYADLFTPDAVLIMGQNTFEYRAGILAFREAGWTKVATRKHVCRGIFVTDKPNEIMTYGDLDYGNRDGSSTLGVSWSGRLQLVEVGGELKIAFYQVWITLPKN